MSVPQAVGYRLVVELDPIEETIEGSVIVKAVETSNKEKYSRNEGTVIDIGEFAYDKYPVRWVNKGDRIVFVKYSGEYFETPEKDYRIINDLDVLAVLGQEGAE